MQNNRCGHFRLEVEELHIQGVPVNLRVPIRRCLLAERMIALMWAKEQGREVARKIVIDGSIFPAPGQQMWESIERLEGRIRAAFGPDLEAIHPMECTTQRCLDACTPGFQTMLRHFEFDEDAERETGAGCSEEATSPDAVGTTGSEE